MELRFFKLSQVIFVYQYEEFGIKGS